MMKIENRGGYKSPKVRIATLKCDCGFAQSSVSGEARIGDWIYGGTDGADD